MDRSFLSDPQVVAASRNFVCIRLATYEDAEEAEFLRSIYIGRSGDVENTTFCLLAPDGKRKLSRASRGPFSAFRDGAGMAASMQRVAALYRGSHAPGTTHAELPLMKSLDLALNVAAADSLPLIVTVADDAAELEQLNQSLVELAWSAELAGQFVYATALDKKDLKPITGIEAGHQILVVEPGPYGLSGKVLTQFAATERQQRIREGLLKTCVEFPHVEKDHQSHVRFGIELGIDWQSAIPETDQQAIQAKERARGSR